MTPRPAANGPRLPSRNDWPTLITGSPAKAVLMEAMCHARLTLWHPARPRRPFCRGSRHQMASRCRPSGVPPSPSAAPGHISPACYDPAQRDACTRAQGAAPSGLESRTDPRREDRGEPGPPALGRENVRLAVRGRTVRRCGPISTFNGPRIERPPICRRRR